MGAVLRGIERFSQAGMAKPSVAGIVVAAVGVLRCRHDVETVMCRDRAR